MILVCVIVGMAVWIHILYRRQRIPEVEPFYELHNPATASSDPVYDDLEKQKSNVNPFYENVRH